VTNWHFIEVPDLTWIVVTIVGLVVFLNAFLGFWLCARTRKVWRVVLHRKSVPISNLVFIQLAMLMLGIASVVCIAVFEHDKSGMQVVWSTHFVQGFLMYTPFWRGNIDLSNSLVAWLKSWNSSIFNRTSPFIVNFIQTLV
jgi:hypothetical protein